MPRIHVVVAAAALAVALAVPAQAQAPKPEPSTAEKVQHWTKKKWEAAKAEWQKDKTKWDSCNARATEQHLTGRKSWSYIYDCMKS
jgi:hypothetical protein